MAIGSSATLPALCTFQVAAYLEQMKYLVPCERCCRRTYCLLSLPQTAHAVRKGSFGCLA